MVRITADICIVGAGSIGLFAALEAGTAKMRCCILEGSPTNDACGIEQALCDYLRAAIVEFNPVFLSDRFLEDIVKTDQNNYRVITSCGDQIDCKHVLFVSKM